MMPKITVLMPVYNGAKYLREAMDSILNQTFNDFEFLIINDGSTDQTEKIIRSYVDRRIRLVSQDNQGLSAALNSGLDLSRGKYIARMDADDVSLPERLQRQFEFMEAHPEIGCSGTWVEIITESGQKVRRASYPVRHEQIKAKLLFNSAFAHPTVMFRREFLNNHNLRYYSDKGEDYELWTRAVRYGNLANLPQILLKYRMGAGISFRSCKNDYDRCFKEISSGQALALVPEASTQELKVHYLMNDYNYQADRQFLRSVIDWLAHLKRANIQQQLYQDCAFRELLANEWFFVCRRTSVMQLLIWPDFWLQSFILFSQLHWSDKINFLRRVIRM